MKVPPEVKEIFHQQEKEKEQNKEQELKRKALDHATSASQGLKLKQVPTLSYDDGHSAP